MYQIGLTGIILSLLIAFPVCAQRAQPDHVNLPPQAADPAFANGQLSDINHDGRVDAEDVTLFSRMYLDVDAASVDWCDFHQATASNERYFRTRTSSASARYSELLDFIATFYSCQTQFNSADKSDMNQDGVVGLDDLIAFSTIYLERYWETIDWCVFYEHTVSGSDFEGNRTRYFLKHFQSLLAFANHHFNCGGSVPPPPDVLLENEPVGLARIASATGISSDYYLSDPRVGSIFVYDSELQLKAEIKGLDRPLGVAVDALGNVLVGNDGRDNVEVYDPETGELLAVFGEGLLLMPTAITHDLSGNIYVTDSRSHNVKVFDAAYNLLRIIGRVGVGDEELTFPVDTVIIDATGEVLVADQGNIRIQIYDLEGNWLRTIVNLGVCSWWRGCTVQPFRNLSALDLDSLGRLHVVDNFVATVMIFDPADGAYQGSYGVYGEGPGYLRMPTDVLITESDTSMVVSGDGDRIEVMAIPW